MCLGKVCQGFVLYSARCCYEAEAAVTINECISGLYCEGLFVRAERAEQIALKGLYFLKLYAQLADLCFKKKKKRFPLVPKGHYLHHQFLHFLHQSRRTAWVLNELAFAVQMEEDYIGRPSRLARRVSCRATSLRVIQRTFLAVRNALYEDDLGTA